MDVEQKRVGIGVVVQNHEGKVVAALSESRSTTFEPEWAEMLAAWNAVEFYISIGMRKVVVEGDALTVACSLQGVRAVGDVLGTYWMILYKRCRILMIGA